MHHIKLSEAIELISGGTPKTSESSYWGGDIPWLSVKDFGSVPKYVFDAEKHITQEGFNNCASHMLYKDDIIISARGTVGALAMIGTNMAFNQSCYGIRGKEGIDNHYLFYLLKTKIAELNANSHGSVFSTITRNTFDSIYCDIPSLRTQRRIAAILSSLDDKIDCNRRINANLEAQAQALFKSWFVDFEPFKDGKFVDSELGRIPGGWEVKTLGDLAEFNKNSVNPTKYSDKEFLHYSLPAFDNGKIPEKQLGKEIHSNKFKLNDNITLISKLNPNIKRIWFVGEASENAICSTEFIPVSARNGKCYAFVNALLNSNSFYLYILSFVGGTTGSHQRFHADDIFTYKLPFNEETADKLNKVLLPMLKKRERLIIESSRLSSLRDILLPRLMSGELRVE